jgi:hypothetical protein
MRLPYKFMRYATRAQQFVYFSGATRTRFVAIAFGIERRIGRINRQF